MTYDAKIGPHWIKTVIDDENQVSKFFKFYFDYNYLGSDLKETVVFEIFWLFMYYCVVKSSVCTDRSC